ncbi:hypothetical protein ED733_007070 [Metarhizium rileyi]|uniref:Uncharacterized protein n=1 Tax=Metarhizium rileyi (strain RCEF 4871) TaxID=1649241 RepID=A0A5C6GEQ5_METRR|nr:hypothetical protein ED733_007070 [Metarhizium rileyi]
MERRSLQMPPLHWPMPNLFPPHPIHGPLPALCDATPGRNTARHMSSESERRNTGLPEPLRASFTVIQMVTQEPLFSSRTKRIIHTRHDALAKPALKRGYSPTATLWRSPHRNCDTRSHWEKP